MLKENKHRGNKKIIIISVVFFLSIFLVLSLFLILSIFPLVSFITSIFPIHPSSISSSSQLQTPSKLGTLTTTNQPTLRLTKYQGLEKYLIEDKSWYFDSDNLYINLTVNLTTWNWMKGAVDNPTISKCLIVEPIIQDDFPTFDCNNANHRDLLLTRLQNFTAKGMKLKQQGINKGYINRTGSKLLITIPLTDLKSRDLIQIGENSLEFVYQNESKIEYKLEWANANLTIYQNQSGSYNLNAENIWIRINKFGANISNMTSNETRSFLYQLQSTSPIIPNNNKPYIRRFTRTNSIPRQRIEEKHHFDFSDVCSRNFGEFFNITSNQTEFNQSASCQFDFYNQVVGNFNSTDIDGNNITINISHYFLNVTFFSDQFIDPKITLSEFVSSDSIDTNITQENNFTHLTIDTTQAPYNNLVAYWSFDINHSTKGNITYDYTANDNDGTVDNGTFNNTGCLPDYGNCLTFDGVDDFVDLGTNDFGSSQGTVSVWADPRVLFNFGNPFFADILGASASGIDFEFYYDASSTDTRWEGHYRGNFGNTISVTGNTTFSSNADLHKWQHVVFTWNNNTGAKIYLNGVLDGTTSTTGNGWGGATNWQIASDRIEWNGSMDEFMIFNTSLTAAQVLDIYNNQSARFKTEGTQEFLSFNISLTDEDRVNVSAGFQRFFQTNVSLDLGLWNITEGYNDSIDGDGNDVAINDSVVLWFHFDNQSDQSENDTHVFDWSGNGNNGTGENGVKVNTTQAIFNGSFTFDGVNDHIDAGDVADILSDTNITFVFWVNPSNLDGTQTMMRKSDSSLNNDAGWDIDRSSTGAIILVYNNGTGGDKNKISTTTLSANQWQNIAVVISRTSDFISFYIDGSLSNTETSVGKNGSWEATEPLFIGTLIPTVQDFNGSIDEVMIFNRSLSSDEITSLYNKGRANYVYTAPQNLTASNENTTFTISNNTEVISSRFKLYATNFSDPFYSSILQPNIIYDFYEAAAAGDQPPVSILSRPANDSNFTNGTIVTFEVNATDDFLLVNVSFILYNPDDTINHTNVSSWNGTSNSTTFTFNFTQDGIYLWNALVTDNASQTDWDVNRTLNISTFVSIADNINPNLTINSPANVTFTTTTITFNATVLDETGVGEAWYSFDQGINNVSLVNLSTSPDEWTDVNSTMAQGSHNVTFYANDTSDNINNSESVVFFIDSINPDINFVPITEANETNLSQSHIQINVTASDTNLQNIIIRLFNASRDLINTSLSTSSPLFFNVTSLPDGVYFFNATANDTLNNVNTTETRVVTLDTTFPAIAIEFPANNSNHTIGLVNVNFTVSDINLQTCSWDNDSMTDRTIIACGTNITNITWSEGLHNVTVFANDSAGNENSSSVTFRIDTLPPSIQFTNQTILDNESLNHDINGTDLGVGVESFAVNGTSPFNITISTGFLRNNSGLPIGNYSVNVSVNDTLGNLNSTIVGIEVRDSTAPINFNPNVTINSPTNISFTTTTISFNVTAVDDDGMSDVVYTLDGGLNNFTMNNLSTSPTEWTAENTTMAQGSHTVIFYANDTSNNLNNSENVTFFIDTIAPAIQFSNQTLFDNDTLSHDINATDDGSGVQNFAINNTANFTITITGGVLTNTTLLPIGNYSIQLEVNDSLGNTNTTHINIEVQNSTIILPDIINPNLTIHSPTNISFITTTITFNVTALDETGMSDVIYSLNGGVDNFTMANTTANITQWSAINTTMAQGSHTVTFFANDTSNNLNNSETITFVVDTEAPSFDNLQNHTQTANTSFFFDLNATDISGVDTFFLNDSSVFNITRDGRIRNVTALDIVAIYFLNVSVNDTNDGNPITSSIFFINITSIGLSINIIFPLNSSTITTTDVSLNITSTGVVQAYKFRLNNDANTTFIPNITLSNLESDRFHIIQVWANDSSGNEVTDIKRFYLGVYSIQTFVYIFGILLAIVLLIFGIYGEKEYMILLAGIIFITTGLFFANNGSPLVNDNLLHSLITWTFIGIGAITMIFPYLNYDERLS